jgi:hypothetical protein
MEVLSNMLKLVVKEDEAKYKSRIQLDEILKKLFYINNNRPIIDFLNSLYGDNLNYDSILNYLNKEAITETLHKKSLLISQECDMFIRVDCNGKRFEYLLGFQTKDDKSIGIRLFRYSFELKIQNISYLYRNDPVILELPNPYVIVLEKNKNVPESYELILKTPDGGSLKYTAKVLKYWQHDLDNLYASNMYLLFPLKIFQVRNKITKVKKMKEDNPKYSILIKEIRDDILKVSKEILEHIEVIYKESKIDTAEYNDFAVVIGNLTLYLCQEVAKLDSIKEEVGTLFKTFYDPEVEKRGELRGELRGEQRGMDKTIKATKMLIAGEDDIKIQQETGLTAEQIDKIKEVLKPQGNQ